MQIPLKNISGQVVKQVSVSEGLFGLPITDTLRSVIHQAVVRQKANARRGTASTKTRGLVSGSTAKLFSQKGTGRARGGSIRSPLRRGGGITFGPHPRSYRQRLPKKMRRLAIRGVLSSKIAEGRLAVVDNLGFSKPRSKDMIKTLSVLGAGSSALVVTPEPRESVIKSAQNLQGVKTLPARYLNVLDLLSHDFVVIELGALRQAEQLWAPEGSPPEAAQDTEQPDGQEEEKKPRPRRKRATRKPKIEAEA